MTCKNEKRLTIVFRQNIFPGPGYKIVYNNPILYLLSYAQFYFKNSGDYWIATRLTKCISPG